MARFCTQTYSRPSQRNLSEVYMHLTNYSLNKHSKNFVVTDREDNGSKRTLTSVFHLLERQGHDVATLWHDIEKLICKTAIAILPELKVYLHAETANPGGGPSCFHVSTCLFSENGNELVIFHLVSSVFANVEECFNSCVPAVSLFRCLRCTCRNNKLPHYILTDLSRKISFLKQSTSLD